MARDWLKAAGLLALVLNVLFFPTLWGNKTLLLSSRDAPSIISDGALHQENVGPTISRTPDPGAPAWSSEPWFKVVSRQYWEDHEVPLWNPYAAYGKPLAAAQQAQPFYPLTLLLSLDVTPRTYDFFIVARLFVAGLLMFLFARLFLAFMPALAAALTFMLSGYFIIYVNMPHLSVEVLAPGILLVFEGILRRNSWASVSIAAAMIFCAVVGGMPESLFLAVAFGGVYFLFRLASAPEFRASRRGRLGRLAVALVLGFGLSALLLAPFAQLARLAHDVHQAANIHGSVTGLIGDSGWRGLVLYLLPYLFGPVGNSILSNYAGPTGMRAYWGLVPCLLAVVAVLRALFPRDALYPKPSRQLTWFFTICLVLLMLKRFGNPVINWIGALPLSSLVLYPKYQEPLMSVCIAMLTGTGFALVAERRIGRLYFWIAAALVTIATLALAAGSLPQVQQLTAHQHIFYGVLLCGGLLVAAMLAWFQLTSPPGRGRLLALGFFALLIADLTGEFFIPSFYLFNRLPPQSSNPYAGAPYLDFLRARDRDYSRVFARENELYPNWAGVFGLADVRSLDAIEYRPYYELLRGFLLKPGDEAREHGDLADRFTGSDTGYDYDFDTDQQQRFLALSSIKYLISKTEYGMSTKVLQSIIDQHTGENIWGFGRDIFPIGDGHRANGVFQHPPSSRIAFKTAINPNRPVFTGVATMREAAQDRSDGVGFTLEIKTGDTIEKLFHLDIDPRDVPADRGGHPFRVDLSAYAGRDVELLFSTDPGPSGSNAYDWAGWARLQFEPESSASAVNVSPFKEIYDREVSIYEVPGVLPRAALYSAAEILPENQVLARLKAADFDLRREVILGRESIAADSEPAVRAFAGAAAMPVRAARIAVYQPEHVRIEAETDAPALLMLNDSDYPGWVAHVNGAPAAILRADYLFRGVVLPAGKSTVDFDYEPGSFRLGAGISTLSLIAVIALPLASRRRRAKTPAAGQRQGMEPG